MKTIEWTPEFAPTNPQELDIHVKKLTAMIQASVKAVIRPPGAEVQQASVRLLEAEMWITKACMLAQSKEKKDGSTNTN